MITIIIVLKNILLLGCDILIYPGAFCMTFGPTQWSLFARCRAVDTQTFVVVASPARDTKAKYVAWGHSMVVDPWGTILGEATEESMDMFIDIGKLRLLFYFEFDTYLYNILHF